MNWKIQNNDLIMVYIMVYCCLQKVSSFCGQSKYDGVRHSTQWNGRWWNSRRKIVWHSKKCFIIEWSSWALHPKSVPLSSVICDRANEGSMNTDISREFRKSGKALRVEMVRQKSDITLIFRWKIVKHFPDFPGLELLLPLFNIRRFDW